MASDWLRFVKTHKNMRTAKGLLDLKAISKLWHKDKPLDLKIKLSRKKSIRLAKHLRKEHPSTKGKMKVNDPAPNPNKKDAIWLQGIGYFHAIPAKDLKKGMVMVWNYGQESEVVKTEPKGNWILVTEKSLTSGNINTTRRKPDRLIAVDKRASKLYDPAPQHSSQPPKSWFNAMYTGIKNRSDVRNPGAIVKNIWAKLTPAKRSIINAQAKKGHKFKYDLPLPDDRATRGTGTLRMVKPFKLAEVQVNLKLSDYLAALKSGLFSKMKRNDGTVALVARCKSQNKNCNIFVDKVT